MLYKPFDPNAVRIAAFDLDGTILHHGQISNATRHAIDALRARGIRIVLSTGRHLDLISPRLLLLTRAAYAVACNGAVVCDFVNGRILRTSPFAPDAAQRLAECVQSQAPACALGCVQGYFASKSMLDVLVEAGASTLEAETVKREFSSAVTFVDDPAATLAAEGLDLLKMEAFFTDEAAARRVLAHLRQQPGVESVSTTGRDVETTVAGVSKATGLAQLCGFFGCTAENVIAFGDSGNDAAMLEWAGYSVAMGSFKAWPTM